MMIIRPLAALCALALAAGSAGPTVAQATAPKAAAKTPGAKPGDREMTCETVAIEREQIQIAVARLGEDQAKSSRRRQGLSAFAKGAVGGALPGMLGQLSGGSYMGSVAAQAASQGAASALNQPGGTQAKTGAPKPTPEQQARLERLGKIAAYRQCADA